MNTKKSNLEMTPMMKRYLLRFALRLSVFVLTFVFYLHNKNHIWSILTGEIYFGISPIHVLWLIFMITMVAHLFPSKHRSMALRKEQVEHFVPSDDYKDYDLLRFVQDMNLKAWKVMLVWLSFNAVFGILYLFQFLDEADLFMLSVFFFLCDYICIMLFCPFQTFIMKNRCCVNCRIYDWGHFMMFTPMLFIKNFFSWSLFFTSLIVLINWEIKYAKYPERFWYGSNSTLQCSNCKDKTCQIKKRLAGKKDN